MPADAPAIKINGVKALGGNVMLYDRQRENREQIGARVAAQTGATLIKPYDDPDVIAGQGTVGLEALTDCRALNLQADAIVCPCGRRRLDCRHCHRSGHHEPADDGVGRRTGRL